jgi:hypothetical protein
MTRLQQLADTAVERMNMGLAPRDYENGCLFELQVLSGFTDFAIAYGNLIFCTGDDLEEPEESVADLVASTQIQLQILDKWINKVQVPVSRINALADYNKVTPETRELIDGLNIFSQYIKLELVTKDQEGATGWRNYGTADIVANIARRINSWKKGKAGGDVSIAGWCLINFLNRSEPQVELPQSLAETFIGEEEKIDNNIEVATHTYKESEYRLITESKIKLAGVIDLIEANTGREVLNEKEASYIKNSWINVVIYKSLSTGKVFVREATEFNEKFTNLSDSSFTEEKNSEDKVEVTTEVESALDQDHIDEIVAEENEINNSMELVDDEEEGNSSEEEGNND